MSELETRAVWPVDLEIREDGRTLRGSFPYGGMATIADRGTVRKERFRPKAFKYSLEREDFEISLLAGHSFDRPLGSKLARTLVFKDSDDALRFTAALPPLEDQPSWMVDAVKAVRAGLVRGISPGFRVPPSSAVANAERFIPEPGNPGVQIREIAEATLYEMSVVTRPAYTDTAVDVRQGLALAGVNEERFYRWL